MLQTNNIFSKQAQTPTVYFLLQNTNPQKPMQIFDSNTCSYIPYYLYPRSSISKTPLLCANSVGIIDRDYRGNIMGKVRYLPFDLEAKDPYLVDKGTRLFQICSPDLHPIKVKLVDQLTETSRGEGGFGSTGVGLSSSY